MKHIFRTLVVALVAVVCSVSCNHNEQVSDAEIAQLQGRLDSIMEQYDNLKSESAGFEGTLTEKEEQIQAQKAEIQSLIAQLRQARNANKGANVSATTSDSDSKALKEKEQQLAKLRKQLDEQAKELKKLQSEASSRPATTNDCSRFENQVAELKTQNSQLGKQIADLKAQIAALNSSVSSVNNDKQSLSSSNQQLQQQVSDLKAQLNTLKDQNSQLNAQVATLSKGNADAQQLSACQQRVDRLQAEADDLRAQIASLQSQMTKMESADGRSQQQLGDLQAQNANLKSQVSNLNAQVSSLQGQLSDKESQLATLAAAQSAGSKAQDNYAAEITALQQQVNEQRSEISRLNQQLKNKESELAQAQAAAQKATADLNASSTKKTTTKKLDELQALCDSYAAEIERLRAENAQLKSENTQLRDEMTSIQKDAEKALSENSKLAQKVALASILVTDGLTVTPAKSISGYTVKSTEKASQVVGVKIEGRILDNNVADPGTITIYARISNAANRIVANGFPEEFDLAGTTMQCTMKQDVEFTGASRKINMIWRKLESTEMPAGLYWVTLYAGGNEIGKTSFVLK